MDEISHEVTEVTPVGAPDAEKVISYIQETELIYDSDPVYCFYQNKNYALHGGELSAENSSFDQEAGSASIQAAYISSAHQASGHYNMSFTGTEWNFTNRREGNDAVVLVIDRIAANFEHTFGTYQLHFPYPEFPSGTLTIQEVTNDTIVYSLSFSGAFPSSSSERLDIPQGENLTAAFDLVSCQCVIGEWHFTSYSAATGHQWLSMDIPLSYDVERSEWRVMSTSGTLIPM